MNIKVGKPVGQPFQNERTNLLITFPKNLSVLPFMGCWVPTTAEHCNKGGKFFTKIT